MVINTKKAMTSTSKPTKTLKASGESIQQLLSRAGCQVVVLPPDSSDLNRIEKFGARLTQQVEQVLEEGMSLFEALSLKAMS